MRSSHGVVFRDMIDEQRATRRLLDDQIDLIGDDDEDEVFSMRRRIFEAIMSIPLI